MNEDPWRSLGVDASKIVGRRVSDPHPLDIYWARAASGAPGIVIRDLQGDWIPRELPKPRGIDISVESVGDVSEIRLFLSGTGERDVFLALCRDVIDFSSLADNRAASAGRALKRLGHWHALMARARSAVMDPHEIRGLIGELVLLEMLARSIGFNAAIKAWVAPDDHPQDFALDTRLVEVKARAAGSRQEVTISSLSQLERGHLPLYLAVVELSHSEQEGAVSLNEIVGRLAALAEQVGLACEEDLASSLIKRGYVRHDQYDVDSYLVSGLSSFEVRDGFPAITRSAVDARIVSVRYVVGLASISEFSVPADRLTD